MNITSGRIRTPQKVVIYGVEGIGKTTFASHFPDPVFIDTEGSTKFLDVKRFDAPSSWSMLLTQIDYVISARPCRTLVLDTIDWAEKLCYEHVLASHNWKSIEDPGYGAGYRYTYDEMGKLLNRLSDVIEAGINVVVTAHAALRKFEQPDEMGSYDRYEMKLQNTPRCNVASMVKEWADCVLFANYKTIIVKDGKGENAKGKGRGGERVIYTTHNPCWDAKNRYGLPDEAPFDYQVIAPVIDGAAVVKECAAESRAQSDSGENVKKAVSADNVDNGKGTDEASRGGEPLVRVCPLTGEPPVIPEELPKALRDLMAANDVDESEIRNIVSNKGFYPFETPITKYDADFINGALIAEWAALWPFIRDGRDLPF